MSPRKTRRGCKADAADETLSVSVPNESKENSAPSSARTARTRRQLSVTISADSGADRSIEMKKSRGRIARETRSVKNTRSRKKARLEGETDDSSSNLDTTTGTKRRTRKSKAELVLRERTAPLEDSTANESTVEKGRASRSVKKSGKKVNLTSEEESSEVESGKRNDVGVKNCSIMGNGGEKLSGNESEVERSNEDAEVERAIVRNSRSRTPRISGRTNPRGSTTVAVQGGRSARERKTQDFTPESSPITVHLSPHRTTKTPRKSPMNLGSPKSHAAQSPRLTKTPRKLPVVEESPSPSEISANSSINGDERDEKSASLTGKKLPPDTSSGKKKKSRGSMKKSPAKSPSKDLSVRKFSKSPKIVLKTPKVKSSKSKSPRVVTGRAKTLKLPEVEKKVDSKIDSPEGRARNTSTAAKRYDTSVTEKSPSLVLSKLSCFVEALPAETTTRCSPRKNKSPIERSSKSTPIGRASNLGKSLSDVGESPRGSKAREKKQEPVTNSGAGSGLTVSPRKSIVATSGNNTPAEKRSTRRNSRDKGRILSSTPRERIRRSLNLSPGLGSTPIIPNTPVNGRTHDPTLSLVAAESTSFNESWRNVEESRLDETFRVAEKSISGKEASDVTYELLEPKTPVLRRKAGKRSLAERETDSSIEERASKRTCRVRFASPSPNPGTIKSGTRGNVRSATPAQRNNFRAKEARTAVRVIDERAIDSPKRSNSMTNLSLRKTPVSAIGRRSNSASAANPLSAGKTAQNASVNRLSRPRLHPVHGSDKKTEVKTPSARKAPNFAQIHERKFAKMESLVEAKKRVEKRHLAINSQIPMSLSKVNTAARSKPKVLTKSPAPNVPINGAYNRYGFKLRKNDALKMVSQKQPPARPSEKKQNENRMVLKGVRTNRRFELIMKARNINQ